MVSSAPGFATLGATRVAYGRAGGERPPGCPRLRPEAAWRHATSKLYHCGGAGFPGLRQRVEREGEQGNFHRVCLQAVTESRVGPSLLEHRTAITLPTKASARHLCWPLLRFYFNCTTDGERTYAVAPGRRR
jgi:hypothetical protein